MSVLMGVEAAWRSQPDRSDSAAAESLAAGREVVDALSGRPGQFRHRKLSRRRRRARLPGTLVFDVFGGYDVQEDRGQVDTGDPIDHAMVDLGDDGELALFEALDDPQLPQRLGAIELLGDDPAGERLQLVVVAGSRKAGVANVKVEVEGVVVDPDRSAVVRDERETLAIARDVLQLRLDVVTDQLDVDPTVVLREGACLEEHDGRHMHVRRPGLECEKRRIEIREGFVEGLSHVLFSLSAAAAGTQRRARSDPSMA